MTWWQDTLANDIALLELREPIMTYTPIAEIDESDGFSSTSGEMMTVAGWGTTSENGFSSDVALTVDVPIVLNTRCNNLYSGDILPTMLCAGMRGRDSYQAWTLTLALRIQAVAVAEELGLGSRPDRCQGDSGGPFFKKLSDRCACVH